MSGRIPPPPPIVMVDMNPPHECWATRRLTTGKEVWWCVEHDMRFFPAPIGECGWWSNHKEGNKCRSSLGLLVFDGHG